MSETNPDQQQDRVWCPRCQKPIINGGWCGCNRASLRSFTESESAHKAMVRGWLERMFGGRR